MFSKVWSKYSKSEFSKNVSSQILETGMMVVIMLASIFLFIGLFREKDFAVVLQKRLQIL